MKENFVLKWWDMATKLPGENELRVAKLTENDDVEAYLTIFEHLMGAYNVNRSRCVFNFAPCTAD